MVTDVSRHSNTGDGEGPSLILTLIFCKNTRTWREKTIRTVTRKEVGQWLLGRESVGSSPQMHYVTRPWLGCQGNLLDWEQASPFTDDVTEVKLPRSTVYKVKELEETAWLQSPNSSPCNIWWIWSKKTAHHWNVFFSKFIAVSLLLLLFTLPVGSHSLWPHGL